MKISQHQSSTTQGQCSIDVALRIDAEIMADALALHDLADPFFTATLFSTSC